MLRFPNVPPDEAGVIVKKFMNNRLIKIMEDIFVEYLACKDAWNNTLKSYDAYVSMLTEEKLDELRKNPVFMKAVACNYAPRDYPKEKSCSDFISLYKLLKVKKEYVPGHLMEYILYQMITEKIEEARVLAEPDENDGDYDGNAAAATILRIPEPDRTKVLTALGDEAISGEFTAEDYMRFFEDLEEYPETCFWDFDFKMLDMMSEEAMTESPLARVLGIGKRQDDVQVEVKIAGRVIAKGELELHPWELEFGK